ncbi:MAG: trehalose-6-phosphate synthase [Chloroflexota bacterium]
MSMVSPEQASTGPLQIVIVSNRGPFSFSMKDGEPVIERGSGGLVTAISSLARQHEILWISCALSKGDREWLDHVGDGVHTVQDMKIRLVVPDPEQYKQYYNVISNPLLWFVQHQLHDTPRLPVVDETTWRAWTEGYTAINRQLAAATAESITAIQGPVLVMPQDYHLYLFPRYLRELVGDRVVIQSFIHIPWPGPDAWRVLPLVIRQELLIAMLQADRIGFQTERDTRRFLQTCLDNLPKARVVVPWRRITYQNRETEAKPYPISVDVDELKQLAGSVEAQSHHASMKLLSGSRRMILRVDRVEPSKNILRGLMAYRNFLNVYPAYRGQVYMLALLVPSRTEVTEYKRYLRDIMALVGEINATLGQSDWEPVRVMLGNNYIRALTALTQYDVLLVNPLADGMNLVAKEGVALNQRNGVLILSEEAGVAEEFGEQALLVSPFDVYGAREAIYQALNMPQEDRHSRAEKLAQQVTDNDIHHWFARQLHDVQHDISTTESTT